MAGTCAMLVLKKKKPARGVDVWFRMESGARAGWPASPCHALGSSHVVVVATAPVIPQDPERVPSEGWNQGNGDGRPSGCTDIP